MSSFVSKNLDFTFLHIPGTINISNWLNDTVKGDVINFKGYPLMSQIESYIKTKSNFSVIRNPWDRMLSMYFGLRNASSRTPDLKKVVEMVFNGNLPDTFDSFISEVDLINRYDSARSDLTAISIAGTFNTPCLEWASCSGKMIMMRYENLSEDFKVVQDIIKAGSPPVLDVPALGAYRDVYSTASKNIVARWFAEDIEYGKYLF